MCSPSQVVYRRCALANFPSLLPLDGKTIKKYHPFPHVHAATSPLPLRWRLLPTTPHFALSNQSWRRSGLMLSQTPLTLWSVVSSSVIPRPPSLAASAWLPCTSRPPLSLLRPSSPQLPSSDDQAFPRGLLCGLVMAPAMTHRSHVHDCCHRHCDAGVLLRHLQSRLARLLLHTTRQRLPPHWRKI